MRNELLYSPLALADLDAIWEYLAIECENLAAVDKTVSKITDSLGRLAEMPDSGTPLDARCITHSSYRCVVTGNHIAFYRHEGTRIYVDRIQRPACTGTRALRDRVG